MPIGRLDTESAERFRSGMEKSWLGCSAPGNLRVGAGKDAGAGTLGRYARRVLAGSRARGTRRRRRDCASAEVLRSGGGRRPARRGSRQAAFAAGPGGKRLGAGPARRVAGPAAPVAMPSVACAVRRPGALLRAVGIALHVVEHSWKWYGPLQRFVGEEASGGSAGPPPAGGIALGFGLDRVCGTEQDTSRRRTAR